MGAKDFKATFGLANGETSQSVITIPITSNSATTIDTAALNSFYSITYNVTITQGSKIRTSKILVQTDGTSVDSTEYGIVATGGAISGVAITATASAGNMLLQVTVTDAATTIARVRAVKNLLGVIQPYLPGAPTIGTATAGAEQATVTFTAPADNGLSAITSYLATSNPSSITGSGASSPITVTGLTAGTSYTFTVTATNSIGTGIASSLSNSIVPTAIISGDGYFAGGSLSNAATSYSSIEKISFVNDSVSTLGATFSTVKTHTNGASNSGVAGYIGGGWITTTSTRSNAIDKLLFSNNSISTIAATLSIGRNHAAAMANSGNSAYFSGGVRQDNSSLTNIIDKLLFSNESISTLSATLSVSANTHGGFANSGTAGYFGGLNNTNIDKISFSNDSRSTLSAIYSTSKSYPATAANSGVAGYTAGGSQTSNIIEKLLFSNDSRSTLSATLGSGRTALKGFAKSGVAGYFGTGYFGTGANPMVNAIDKILFSNDTSTTLGATLSTPRAFYAAFANSGTL